MGRQVAVAAPHHLAVSAARRAVDAGGNAVDAAVAAAAALTVVYPHQCSLGGDLFALVRRADGSMTSINGSGAYRTRPVPVLSAMPLTGPLSVSVPGVVSGWERLIESGASLPASELLEPAIELARGGVQVGERLGRAIAEIHAEGIADAGLRRLLTTPAGDALEVGSTLRQDQLADTLVDLAADGLSSFYRGPSADRLARGFERLGIPVTAEDLQAHRVVEEAPLVAETGGLRVATSPPNSQGYLLLSTLLALDELEARGIPADHTTLVRLFTFAEARREAELGDPRHMAEDVRELLAPDRVARDVDRLLSGAEPVAVRRSARPTGDTVAVTAVDTDGTAVSLIQSLFHSFGSRLRDPETGIVLHNRASFFSVDPASPNALGPGRRPAHTLMPVLVEHPDGRVSAYGTMGGKAQPQIHLQLLRRSLAGMTPDEAVTAPRFIVGGMDAGARADFVLVEPELGEEALAGLRASGLPLRAAATLDEEVGHAMICSLGADGSLAAGADPRSDGAAFPS